MVCCIATLSTPSSREMAVKAGNIVSIAKGPSIVRLAMTPISRPRPRRVSADAGLMPG